VALDLLARAEAGPLGEFQQACADLVRAQVTLFATSRVGDAAPLLLRAAKRLEPIDAGLARATYLDAVVAADFASRLASPGGSLPEVARAAAAAPPPPHPPRAPRSPPRWPGSGLQPGVRGRGADSAPGPAGLRQ
jgi:hypothetical protein